MKKKEPKITILKKEKNPNNPKDYLPNNLIDKLIPQSSIYYPQNKIEQNNNYKPLFFPNDIPEEWNNKTIEEINEEIYSNEQNTIFSDEDHDIIIGNIPLYLIEITNNSIEWERPSSYVINYYLDKEVHKVYPKKNPASMRQNIKRSYIRFKMRQNNESNSSSDNDDFLQYDDFSMKNAIYKDFYIFLEKKYDFKVVNFETRIEINEEEEIKKINEEKKENNKIQKKNIKKKKNAKMKEESVNIEENKEKINILKPSILSMKDFLQNHQIQNSFYTWITSIFQIILDNNIPDIETGKSILLNIYPQKNGIPIYNPNGKYIIKLYLMGKSRKIIIDDRIPCNRNHEYFLPKCNLIEEIWPALFIKALIKLNMYKVRHPFYFCNEEFTDNSLIYELTGMHSFILDMNKSLINVFKEHFAIKSDKKVEKIEIENKIETPKEKEKINKRKKSRDLKEINEELKPIINYPSEEKYYFAVFNYEKICPITIKETDSYYDIIEFIDRQNQKNGTYVNIQYRNPRKVSIEKNDNLKLSLKLLNQIEEKTSNNSNHQNSINNNISPISVRRNKKKYSTINQKKLSGLLSNKKKEKLISDNNLISNFLYTISDFFNNGTFNMKRLKFLDFSDLQKELSDKKTQFKQLAPNEKKQYLLNRQKLKKEKLEEKNKRLRELKENGIQYTLIKLVNQSIEIHDYQFFNEYNEEQIKLAKKCILNNWNFPPPETFENEFKLKEEEQKELKELLSKIDVDSKYKQQIEKLEGITKLSSFQNKKEKNKNKNKPIGIFAWTKEIYIDFIGNDLEIYKKRNEDPKVCLIEGCWITFNDLMNNFNKILIIQNQNKIYHDKLLVDNSWSYFQTDCFEPLIDYNIFLLNPNPLINFQKDNYCLIVIFEPYTEKFKLNTQIENIIFPYISFDLIDKSNKCIIQNNIILNKFYSIYSFDKLDRNNEYLIKINGGDYPTGYILQIMTEAHKIQNISFNKFLCDSENFLIYENQVYIPIIEKNKYYQFAKYNISSNDDLQHEYINIRISVNYEFKYLKKYINIFLKNENSEKRNIELDKIIKINKKEFLSNKTQTLIFSIKPEENLNESEIGIKILYNEQNLKFNFIEEIEPFEINDKYIPNKKGLIFSYYLYPSEKITTSININLYHFINEIKDIDTNNKSKKIGSSNIYIESKPLEKDYRIILELYKLTKEPSLNFSSNSTPFSYSNQGILIKKWDFYNEIIISNLNFEGEIIQDKKKKNDKKENKEEEKQIYIYSLICYFDLSEIDNEFIMNNNNILGYTIRIFSSNYIGFIKDYSKIEHEKLIKEEWENKDSGRTLRASKSRKRYLLQQKQNNNEKLNEEEKKDLEEERKRRSANEIDNIKDVEVNNNNNTKKNGLSKRNNDSKKNKKEEKIKKEENEDDINNNKTNINFPRFNNLLEKKSFSMNNIFKKNIPNCKSNSKYIINYYKYSRSNRTIYCNINERNKKSFNQNSNVMNEEKIELKKKNIYELYEKSKEKYRIDFERFNSTYSEFGGTLKNLNRTSSMFRLSRINKEKKLLSQRNSIKDFIQNSIDIKNKMNEVIKDNINNNNNNNIDFEELLNIYREGVKILGRENDSVEKYFNSISKKKEEIIEQELKKFNNKDKSTIIKILEDIEYNKWKINELLVRQLKDIIKEE